MDKKFTNYLSMRSMTTNFSIWLLVMALSVLAAYSDALRADRDFVVSKNIIFMFFAFLPWSIFSYVLYFYIKQAIYSDHHQKVIKFLIASILLWLPLYLVWDVAMIDWSRGKSISELPTSLANMPAFYLMFDTVILVAIFGCCIAVASFRLSQQRQVQTIALLKQKGELELKISEMKMQALQSQLEPHFLFNALNAISSLVRVEQRKQALKAISRLSELLRFAVESSSQKLINITDEFKFIEDYLALQELRYGHRLTARLDNKSHPNSECPPYTLQCLVENAVCHTLDETELNVEISILVSSDNGLLEIRVINKPAVTESQKKGLGVGISNLRQRLQLIYGNDFSLNADATPEGYSVVLVIPVEKTDD